MIDHQKLQELFLAACDLPESEHSKFVDEHCSDDDSLRKELELLLRTDARKEGIFADDKITEGIQFKFDSDVENELPKQIGNYQIKRVLGEGGMGVVYLAQQLNPARDVAVKVIRRGMVSSDLLKRFEIEAAVLGRLTHPGIANIFEADIFVDETTGLERPFLAMEYVAGKPLRQYVKDSKLSSVERLGLFVQVCEAVHHAHQRGVIHRDLKPGNILVKEDGQPCILDFGVARATGMDPGMSTLQTQAGQLIGTLPYMSPEQVVGNSLDVDIRSDVYSLGVIAYELLSGELPYEVNDAEYLKFAKAISEEPPISLASRSREFRGDLNTVIHKALEKETGQRYQSTKELGDDIQRFLSDQPIIARPATAWYQIRQFAKRNKAIVAGLVASLVLLTTGVLGTSIGMFNAQQEANRKIAVNQFMKDILIAEDSKSGNPDIKMMEVLRAAAAKAPDHFRDYPELEAEVLHLLGRAFNKISIESDAVEQLRRAFELRKTQLGVSHLLTQQTAADFLAVLAFNDAATTKKIADELLQSKTPAELQSKHAIRMRIARAEAQSRMDNNLPALKELRDIRRITNTVYPDDGELLKDVEYQMAVTLRRKINLDGPNKVESEILEAVKLFRDAISFDEQKYGAGHQDTLRAKLNLAIFLNSRMVWLEAEDILREIIQNSKSLGNDHTLNVQSRTNLAWVLYQQANFAEASDYFLDSVERHRKRGPLGKNVYGIVLLTDGLPILEAGNKFVEGEELARILLDNPAGDHGNLAASHRLFLARFLSGRGRNEEAETEFLNVKNSMDFQTVIFSN